jgi:hypothetical protein
MHTTLRIFSVAALLTLLRGTLAALAAPTLPTVSYLAWLALADVVIASVLVTIASHSAWRGTKLIGALFVVAFGVGTVGTLTEAVLFHLFPVATVGRLALSATLVGLLGALATTRVAGEPAMVPAAAPGLSLGGRIGRFVGSSFIYTVCYLGAGIAVLPFVRHFYEAGGLPSGGATLGMQLFIRGPLLVAIGILVVRMTTMTRVGHAFLVAAVMARLGGVAPLLVPNPFLPDAVRWAHLIEITVSNAVFGWLLGWIYSAGAVRNS